MFVSPMLASADTLSDLRAQLQALIAQIALIQSQVSSSDGNTTNTGTSTPSTTLACANISHMMGSGDTDANTGGDVTRLQTFLYERGYLSVTPTGVFGPLTVRAVRDFQLASGISAATGYVGPLTLMAIRNSCGTTSTSSNTTSGGTMCSADARQCPDGSWVGRTGPNCTFACAAVTSPVATTTSGYVCPAHIITPVCGSNQHIVPGTSDSHGCISDARCVDNTPASGVCNGVSVPCTGTTPNNPPVTDGYACPAHIVVPVCNSNQHAVSGTLGSNGCISDARCVDNNNTSGVGAVCSQDARQCPDGSWVGRTGPNCTFACAGTTLPPTGSGYACPAHTATPICNQNQHLVAGTIGSDGCMTNARCVDNNTPTTSTNTWGWCNGVAVPCTGTGSTIPPTTTSCPIYSTPACNGTLVSSSGGANGCALPPICVPTTGGTSGISLGSSGEEGGGSTASCTVSTPRPTSTCSNGGTWTFHPTDSSCHGAWECVIGL